MGTEIRALYNKPECSDEESFEKPFYCRQTPLEVLQILFPKFHIAKYNTLETPGTVVSVPRLSTPGLKFPTPYYVHGLSIKEYIPENGLAIVGNIMSFDMNIRIPNVHIGKGREIVENLIEMYLIEKRMIDNEDGKEKVVEYVKERKENINIERERNLEDIIEYGRVSIGEEFDIKIIEKMSAEIVKNKE